jgi:hypothetical protein
MIRIDTTAQTSASVSDSEMAKIILSMKVSPVGCPPPNAQRATLCCVLHSTGLGFVNADLSSNNHQTPTAPLTTFWKLELPRNDELNQQFMIG